MSIRRNRWNEESIMILPAVVMGSGSDDCRQYGPRGMGDCHDTVKIRQGSRKVRNTNALQGRASDRTSEGEEAPASAAQGVPDLSYHGDQRVKKLRFELACLSWSCGRRNGVLLLRGRPGGRGFAGRFPR